MTAAIAAHGLRRALADRAALGEHVDALAEPHDQPQVVVDDQHGEPALVAHHLDRLQQRVRLGLVHAGGRLVQKEEARATRERAGDLDAALLAVRERRRQALAVGSEPESASAAGPRRRACSPRPRHRPRRSRAPSCRANSRICWNVRPDAEPGEHVRRCPVAFARRPHAAGRRPQHAARDVQRGRLAAAVGADQADDLALRAQETSSSARTPRNCLTMPSATIAAGLSAVAALTARDRTGSRSGPRSLPR